MPEALEPGSSRRRDTAVDEVQAWLHELEGDVHQLTSAELQQHRARRPVVGWRLVVQVADSTEELELLLDHGFPRTQPRVLLANGLQGRVFPHVEKDGALCLYPSSSSFSPYSPAELAKHALGSAVTLIEDSLAGRNEDDFREEFLSYWELYANVSKPSVRSLLNPEAKSRPIRAWFGKTSILAAESDDALWSWLRNRFDDEGQMTAPTEQGVLLWLPQAILPADYPSSPQQLLKVVRRATAAEAKRLVEAAGADSLSRLLVVLGFATDAGSCYAATILSGPSSTGGGKKFGAKPLTAGFRPGRVPAQVLGKRWLSKGQLRCAEVDRVDHAWVHGRDQDARASALRSKRVTVIGCGSVGAPVANSLAQAGVGNLDLVDPEVLVEANIGRHPLGTPSVREHKASELQKKLRVGLPHLAVQAYPERWESASKVHPQLLEQADLVISAVGKWSCEGALNEWHVHADTPPPVVYGWTEAHACAGHAVVIWPNTRGCLQCGLNDFGELREPAVEWPDGPTLRHEPACGASFQPYGPVELNYITAMISELALDCLLGTVKTSRHRFWLARQATLDAAGGQWTTRWNSLVEKHGEGAFVNDAVWISRDDCPECGVGA